MGRNVVDIGMSAFYSCHALKAASLPDSVETIGDDAFYDCPSLEGMDLGTGLRTVGSGAFRACPSLRTLEFPDALERVGDKALAYCTGLTDVYFIGDAPEFGSAVFLNVKATIHCTEAHAGSWSGFDGIVVDRPDGSSNAMILAAIAIVIVAVAAVLITRRRSG